MIVSCGVYIFENRRLKQAHERYGDKLLRKIFTEDELAYALGTAHCMERLGARFAAKCACFQAMAWDRWRPYKEIYVVKDALGAPRINMSEPMWTFFRQTGATSVHLSITHIKECSLAQVITEKI
ncbi:MAG: holo-ACP synthase [Candidatus Auribacterota bacterium]|jgi:holo-[acyl-carrier protein] synthase|nr:holo-ACP synthase [Candidatus Auribacterota bacterium]